MPTEKLDEENLVNARIPIGSVTICSLTLCQFDLRLRDAVERRSRPKLQSENDLDLETLERWRTDRAGKRLYEPCPRAVAIVLWISSIPSGNIVQACTCKLTGFRDWGT
jgi:hypothetical protein